MADGQFSFPVWPLSQWRGHDRVPYRKIEEITTFSYDSDRTLHHDDRARRYYHPPNVPQDLSLGFDSWQRRDESIDEHLDALLSSLTRSYTGRHRLEDVHVVTWRGMMTKLLTCAYQDRDSWSMRVQRLGKTIYIEEDLASKEVHRAPPDRKQLEMMYWGYRFEDVSCHDEPSLANGQARFAHREAPLENSTQWCSIVRAQIGSVSLILGGEVDCIESPSGTSRPAERPYIELKTNKEIRTQRDLDNFERRKLLQVWAQSYLLGVPKIIFGFRTMSGQLVSVEEFETLSLPRQVRTNRSRPLWDGQLCLAIAEEILKFVCDTVRGESEMWTLRWDPGTGRISLDSSPMEGTASRRGFLALDFIKEMSSM